MPRSFHARYISLHPGLYLSSWPPGESPLCFVPHVQFEKERDLSRIEWFYSIQDILAAETEAPSAQVRNDIPVHHIRKALYYITLLKYLKARSPTNDSDDEWKEESLSYELRNGILYNLVLNTSVIITLKDLMATIEAVQFSQADI